MYSLSLNSWKSGTAALLALAVTSSTVAPLLTSTPASAQLFPQSPRSTERNYGSIYIPSGTTIPVRYDEAKKIVVSPEETAEVTLTVASDIVNRRGDVLIPAGSKINGQLEPAEGGSQFVAKELVTDRNRRQTIDATSQVIEQTQVSRGADAGNILKGAAAGSAAAAALSGLIGNRKITLGKVLIGAGGGAIGGAVLGRKKADVVVINPDEDLDLTLNSSLEVRY